MRRLTLVLLAVLATTLPAYATVRNVPSQYPTIQAGIDASINGDTVLVAQGVYNEHIDFLGKAIVLRSQSGPELTTIQKAISGTAIVRFATNEGASSIINGFTVRGSSGAPAIYINSASPSIINNVFQDNVNSADGGALHIIGGSFPSISGNSFTNNKALSGGSIVVYQSSVLLSGNSFYGDTSGAHGGSVFIRQSNESSVHHNLFYKNHCPSIGGAIAFSECHGGNFYNNTLAHNSNGSENGAGMTIWYSSDFQVYNNIIVSNSGKGLYSNPTNNSTATYNDVWGNTIDYSGITPGVGSISLDPLFVDGDPFDYHLQPTSPCIDAGDPASPLDPDGTRADMGAFYYHQTSSYYVSPSGNDLTGDGSETNPFQTIAHALGLTTPLDTILALPGAYSEALFINHGITLLSTTGPEVTTLQGIANRRVVTIHYAPDTVRVSGFTITGGYPIGDSLGDRGGAILAIASPIVVENCHIQGNRTPFAGANCTGGALHIRQGSSFVIRGNQITGNSADRGGAIMVVESAGGRIEGNLISGNSSVANAAGVYLYAAANLPPWVTLSGNTITGNHGCLQGNGVTSLRTNLELSANILAGNSPAESCDSAACFGLWAVQCSTALDCNDLFTNAPTEYYSLGILPRLGTYFPGIRDISSDPLFCHPDTGNFQIANESPCAAANNSCGTLIGAYDVGCAVDRTVYHVATTGDDTTGFGSVERPFRTIQRGIDASSDGDTVLIAAGTYTGEGNRRIFIGGKSICIVGSGMEQTFIDAEGDSSIIDVRIGISEPAISISNLTARNAIYGIGPISFERILYRITLKNINIENCIGVGIGSTETILFNSLPWLFEDCTFYNNQVAVAFPNGESSFKRCLFIENAKGVYNWPDINSLGIIDSCQFYDNSISVEGGKFQITNTVIKGGNPAVRPLPRGNPSIIRNCEIDSTQIAITGSEDYFVAISNSLFRHNQTVALFEPGLADYATFEIDSCLFKYNQTAFNWRINLKIKNSLLENNSIPIKFDGMNLRLENCTITNSDSFGVKTNTWVSSKVINTIISNSAGPGLIISQTSPYGLDTVSCCNIFSNSGGNYVGIPDQTGINGNISVDPLFCDTASGDFHLASNSPCREEATGCGQMGAYGVECGPNLPPYPCVIYVDDSNIAGPWEGTIENPLLRIQDGINASRDLDTVMVKPGMYTGNGNRELSLLGKSIVVKGTVLAETTFIDPGPGYNAFRLEDSSYGFQPYIKEMVIQNADWGVFFNGPGGPTLYLSMVVFRNCLTGLGNPDSFPAVWEINKCRFEDNQTGIYGRTSFVWADTCEFSNNVLGAHTSFALFEYCGFNGDSIGIREGANVVNSSFFNNYCCLEGFFPSGSIFFVRSCQFDSIRGTVFINVDNILESVVRNSNQIIYSKSSNIQSCQFINNTGGIICDGDATSLMMWNCLYARNGGRIRVSGAASQLDLLGCTISRNLGDGVYFSGTALSAKNLIVEGNGGAGFLFGAPAGSFDIGYCDVFSNGDGNYVGIPNQTGLNGNISQAPNFASPDSGDFHLRAHSPCIDFGDPASPLDPDSTRADMGAFYYHQSQIEPFELASPDSGMVIASNLPALFWNRAIHNDTDVVITYKAY